MASPFVELEIGKRTVKVTNPDKVLFPDAGHTKRDLVDYYLAVGDGIVRALRERPTQLRRFPDGIAGEQIYQKRIPEKRPEWVEAARVTFPSGRHADELCVTEVAQVVWAANLAVVDFHPWPSRRADVDRPDELRIDVDPQPGTTFADGKRVAAVVGETLDEMGYVGWPKTSGNRGIHIAVRIEPNWEFPVVRRCALAFAREIERRAPELVTTAWWKEERGEKVFIDYNQNARDRTIASAYSVRPRPDATVSAPVTWEELADVETEDFTLVSMQERFARLGDVQSGIDDVVCDLEVLLGWVEREEAEGVGEAPYPPNFPKMPGEPARVQPSRARKTSRRSTGSTSVIVVCVAACSSWELSGSQLPVRFSCEYDRRPGSTGRTEHRGVLFRSAGDRRTSPRRIAQRTRKSAPTVRSTARYSRPRRRF